MFESQTSALPDSVVRIAERTASAESVEAVMTRVRNALAFLVNRW